MSQKKIQTLRILEARGVIKLRPEQSNALSLLCEIESMTPLQIADEITEAPNERLDRAVKSTKRVGHKFLSKLTKLLEEE